MGRCFGGPHPFFLDFWLKEDDANAPGDEDFQGYTLLLCYGVEILMMMMLQLAVAGGNVEISFHSSANDLIIHADEELFNE